MNKLSEQIKKEADKLFNNEVASVEPEDFDVVYETITRDFKLGAVSMASEILKIIKEINGNDLPPTTLDKMLEEFIEEQIDYINNSLRYL